MKKIINILVSLLLVMTLSAQEKLSLSQAITIALETNYDLQLTQNAQEIAAINNTWGNTSLMPSLNFTLSGRENFNTNDIDNYREQTISPELSLNWVIFNGFSAKINKARFDELETQSEGNTAILVENTIQDIILAYNNCLLQEELLQVYKALLELSEDRYQRSEDSREIGATTSYMGLQAKTSWLEDQSNYLKQKVAFENAVRTLNYNLGIKDDVSWTFSTALCAEAKPYQLEDLKEKLKSNNVTLKNQYLYQSLLAKETQMAKNEYLPTLSMNTGLNNSDYYKTFQGVTPTIDNNSYNAYVGLTLSWNIFSGGSRKRGVEIAKVNEASAEVKTEQMAHSLDNQLMQIYSNYNVNKAVLNLAEEQEALAQLNLNMSYEKLQSGSINSFNYRDVQVAYMNAAISKLSAYYNLIQSNTDLMRITGGIVDEYQPEAFKSQL